MHGIISLLVSVLLSYVSLSSEESLNKMVDFLVLSAEEGSTEMRKFKYPYMSCEVICLEIADVVDNLVNSFDRKFLVKLFQLLDNPSPLNSYLAGYFEKVLEMLFRKQTTGIMTFINDGGLPLFNKFLMHIDNYSIMQIVQRLMLPHIPFSSLTENEIQEDEVSCQWSSSEEYCNLLCIKMVDSDNLEVSSHISDLLITVVQLALPDSKVISNLCSPVCLERLLEIAFPKERESSASDISSPSASVSISIISVLESLVSRLGESLTPESVDEKEIEYDKLAMFAKGCVEVVSSKMASYFDCVASQLKSFMESDGVEEIRFQSHASFLRLGSRGLQLVKLVESLARLDDVTVETRLKDSGVLIVILDLMFCYHHNSILHLSVQRIVSTILQGGSKKRDIQEHVLIQSNFLVKIIEYLVRDQNLENPLIAGSKSPLLGHLIVLAQTVNAIVTEESDQETLENPKRESCLNDILENSGIRVVWSEFVENTLSIYIDRQTSNSMIPKAGGDYGFMKNFLNFDQTSAFSNLSNMNIDGANFDANFDNEFESNMFADFSTFSSSESMLDNFPESSGTLSVGSDFDPFGSNNNNVMSGFADSSDDLFSDTIFSSESSVDLFDQTDEDK